ncbi:MAG: FAD-dependent oxidoreductase, partial [Selenomonas artemidis]
SDTYLDKLVLTRKSYNGHNVAVIGAGPAGIVVAVKLAQEGYGVTIFERMQQIGGMLRYGIPDFRLPPSTIDRYGEKLRTLGIHIRPNTTIGSALRVDDLFRDGYEAIFMGTGAWRAKALKIPGETLGNCHYAVNYLQNPDVYHLGDRVAVIGSGNSAMDVARTAIRKGSRYVTIYARRNGISASERELEYALMDGCEIEYAKGIHSVTPEGPMMYDRVFDEEQNLVSEGAPYLIPADSTVIAASQGVKDKIVRTTKGVTLNEKGLVKIDENGMTERDGVFAAGDVVLGPWNVVQVVKDAKHVADAMIRYLEARSAAV